MRLGLLTEKTSSPLFRENPSFGFLQVSISPFSLRTPFLLFAKYRTLRETIRLLCLPLLLTLVGGQRDPDLVGNLALKSFFFTYSVT